MYRLVSEWNLTDPLAFVTDLYQLVGKRFQCVYFMLLILRSNKNIYAVAVLTLCFSTHALPQLFHQSHRERKLIEPLSSSICPHRQNRLDLAIDLKFVEASIFLWRWIQMLITQSRLGLQGNVYNVLYLRKLCMI
jgi:hypothetical protein